MKKFIDRRPVLFWGLVAAAVLVSLAVILSLIIGGGSESDYTATLFTYRHGKLDVNIGNVFLLVFVIAIAFNIAKD